MDNDELNITKNKRRKAGRYRRARSDPQAQAPQNSTQFIIDDHENSAFSIDDFERSFITAPGNREDVGWSQFFQQDFENVYGTTRESEPMDWPHVLLDKISSVETRVESLEQQLDMSDDPSSSSSQSEDEDEEGVQNGTDTDSSDGDTTDGEEATDERTAANSVNDRVPPIPDSQISATVQGDEEAAPSWMEDEEDGANAEEVNSSRRGSERTESVQSVEDVINTH